MADSDDLINGYWAAVRKDHSDTETNDYVNLRTAIGLRVAWTGSRYCVAADYPTGVVLLRMLESGNESLVHRRMLEVLRGMR
ncbi:hypothetical protein AB0K25_12975 [Micromonospora sp. NPDC049257]|uniref:hypothetical protein n=1 Tax=Micromonospora sp. NPDC049257 TaxID=3155771 RepID=UPI00343D6DFF